MTTAAILVAPCQVPEPTPGPSGLYVLGLEGRKPEYVEAFLRNPSVDGISLRVGWDQIEPEEGRFDWSVFDAIIPAAKLAGKKLMLRVYTGARSPAWIYERGAERYAFIDDNENHRTYGQVLQMPAPWDPVYQSYLRQLVAVFGEEYADNPTVRIVAVTGGGVYDEMHLPDKQDVDRWHSASYSDDLLIATWVGLVNHYRAVFPYQLLTVAVAAPVQFDHPEIVVGEVACHCDSVGVGLQGNWLSARTDPEWWLYEMVAAHESPVGFQELCPANQDRFGGSLGDAVKRAQAAGAVFLELSATDFQNFPAETAAAHEVLTR